MNASITKSSKETRTGSQTLQLEERVKIGKQARESVPFEMHSKLSFVPADRDLVEILEISNHGRAPELIPIRYGRMLVSPFAFFRGSAALMAKDLSMSPVSGFYVQACGDCHIQNFGAFATAERQLVVDINDYDESLPAPWEWDLKRLGTSLVLAALANGYSYELGMEAARRMAKSYRQFIAELSEMSHLEEWYYKVAFEELSEGAEQETRERGARLLEEAIEKSSPEVLMEKLVEKRNGVLRFREVPPLLCHIEGISAGATEKEVFEEYCNTLSDERQSLLRKFQLVDVARKVVGIGSVGTFCGVVLLTSERSDILVLQIKEARQSVLEPYAGKSKYAHHGQRVVSGQKLMQTASDMFLGWTTGKRPPFKHFYVRQLRDVKIAVNTAYWSKEDFKIFSKVAGRILAKAHARSGDSTILRAYLGKSEQFDESIAAYSLAYAKQTEQDYRRFVRACKLGKLKAELID
jgi:uncharacterized protein (DUF2252 family)